MMMCGGNKKEVLSGRNGGNLHTHTHTYKRCREKFYT